MLFQMGSSGKATGYSLCYCSRSWPTTTLGSQKTLKSSRARAKRAEVLLSSCGDAGSDSPQGHRQESESKSKEASQAIAQAHATQPCQTAAKWSLDLDWLWIHAQPLLGLAISTPQDHSTHEDVPRICSPSRHPSISQIPTDHLLCARPGVQDKMCDVHTIPASCAVPGCGSQTNCSPSGKPKPH